MAARASEPAWGPLNERFQCFIGFDRAQRGNGPALGGQNGRTHHHRHAYHDLLRIGQGRRSCAAVSARRITRRIRQQSPPTLCCTPPTLPVLFSLVGWLVGRYTVGRFLSSCSPGWTSSLPRLSESPSHHMVARASDSSRASLLALRPLLRTGARIDPRGVRYIGDSPGNSLSHESAIYNDCIAPTSRHGSSWFICRYLCT
jgi:hypothetical protein